MGRNSIECSKGSSIWNNIGCSIGSSIGSSIRSSLGSNIMSSIDFTAEFRGQLLVNNNFRINTLIGKILNNSEASDNGIVIMGSSENSDLCASVLYAKNALKAFLLTIQKYGSDDL